MKMPVNNVRDKDLMTKDRAIEFIKENISVNREIIQALRSGLDEIEKDGKDGLSFPNGSEKIIIKELQNIQGSISDVINVLQHTNGMESDMWRAVTCWFMGNEIYWRAMLNVVSEATDSEILKSQRVNNRKKR